MDSTTKFILLCAYPDLALDDRWITVKPNGKDAKGAKMLIGEGGEVKAGAGGKFNGQKIGELKTKKNLDKRIAELERKQKESNKNQGSTSGLIFGRTMAEINNGQQRGGGMPQYLASTRTTTQSTATELDKAMLEKHGLAGLEKKQLYGIIGRLKKSGIV